MSQEEPVQIDPSQTTPERLSAVLDCVPYPTILVGQDLAIEAANRRFRSVYAGDQEVRGRPCYEVSHGSPRPCDLAGEECPLQSSRRSGQTCRAFHVHMTPRGREHVEVTVRPVQDSDGKVTSFVESLRRSTIASAEPSTSRLVGRSPLFNRVLEMVERAAPADSSVLLVGEPGTGREAVARAVHDLSPRSNRAFLPVDCSGAREPWFEMEFFGSDIGSGPPGWRQRPGFVELARGGTLYLNEVGEMPVSAQARLLRALETGTFRHVGGSRPIPADFRLVCSTSADPQRLADERRLLPELLLRIGGLSVPIPPLRERLDDLELLVDSLLQGIDGCRDCRLGSRALAALRAYTYPGNLRELHTILEHACILSGDEVILPEHLPVRIREKQEPRGSSLEIDRVIPFAALEQRYLAWASHRIEDRRSLSRKLGWSERTLYRKLQKLAAN